MQLFTNNYTEHNTTGAIVVGVIAIVVVIAVVGLAAYVVKTHQPAPVDSVLQGQSDRPISTPLRFNHDPQAYQKALETNSIHSNNDTSSTIVANCPLENDIYSTFFHFYTQYIFSIFIILIAIFIIYLIFRFIITFPKNKIFFINEYISKKLSILDNYPKLLIILHNMFILVKFALNKNLFLYFRIKHLLYLALILVYLIRDLYWIPYKK